MKLIDLKTADQLANLVVSNLDQFCERIEIVGSVRRRKSLVKDIEVLCIPRFTERRDLFGIASEKTDELTEHLTRCINDDSCTSVWQKRVGANGTTAFGSFNKYMLFDGYPVDVFSTTIDLWGWSQFVRTGPKDWNMRAMARLRSCNRFGEIGRGIYDQKTARYLALPDERSVFAALEADFVIPEKRR